MDVLLIFKATLAGVILGTLFEKAKLPIPAPSVFAGVLGILGVLIGGKIVEILL